MKRNDIETEIRTTLTQLSEEDASHVAADADLSDAIGLDSLGRLELLSEMEERFDLTIYEIDSDKASTIAGMAEIVEAALLDQAEAA